jgi:hypothetical protein
MSLEVAPGTGFAACEHAKLGGRSCSSGCGKSSGAMSGNRPWYQEFRISSSVGNAHGMLDKERVDNHVIPRFNRTGEMRGPLSRQSVGPRM